MNLDQSPTETMAEWKLQQVDEALDRWSARPPRWLWGEKTAGVILRVLGIVDHLKMHYPGWQSVGHLGIETGSGRRP